jgi:membrane-bound lytic murein transglycosylase A
VIRAGAVGGAFGAALGALALMTQPASAQYPVPEAGDARLERLDFAALDGWVADDHGAAFRTFVRSCEAMATGAPALRPASPAGEALLAVCRRALEPDALREGPRAFFEAHFVPVLVSPPSGKGFLTGYFEPEYEGSLQPSPDFPTPLLARPDDLVTVPQGETRPGLEPGLQGARRRGEGYEPYPDRAAIEEGALGERARSIAWVRGPAERFIIQVQGSARLRLPGGGVARVAYSGRNGHAYTSIGRILVQEGRIPLPEMSLERLMGWLKDNPDAARDVMRRNRSFVFFRLADELDPGEGPIGGAGISLVPGRSLAVDRGIWAYGLPVWLEGALPVGPGVEEPLRRLMVAQDTGSAIVGPARGDFYFGSGAEAGTRAGLLRHPVRFVVLQPRS